jgi:ABC-type transporter Mla subunit MlaD
MADDLESKFKQLADSMVVSNRILIRLENRVEEHESQLDTLTEALSTFIRETQRGFAQVDEAITRLTAAQLVTEEKLQRLEETVQRFINSLRGRNGDEAS